MSQNDRWRIIIVILGVIALLWFLQALGLAAPPKPTPPALPGGKAVYVAFPDNVTLLYQCSEGRAVAVPWPSPPAPAKEYSLRCVTN